MSFSFVGQEIIAYGPPDGGRELCYWVREKRSSTAEVDYLVSIGDKIIPVEVKSGRAAHHKSLTAFLRSKPEVSRGALITARPPTRSTGRKEDRILRLPLYAVSRLFRDQPITDH